MLRSVAEKDAVAFPSRSCKPLRLAYDSLRLASRLAVVSTEAA